VFLVDSACLSNSTGASSFFPSTNFDNIMIISVNLGRSGLKSARFLSFDSSLCTSRLAVSYVKIF
jgi:hypothetical protein